jgi:hypothetical protein
MESGYVTHMTNLSTVNQLSSRCICYKSRLACDRNCRIVIYRCMYILHEIDIDKIVEYSR